MKPSDIFWVIFRRLSAHDKTKMRVGKFLVSNETFRIYSDEVIATVRVFETSGIFGLKRKLLFAGRQSSKETMVSTLYYSSSEWVKEFQEAINA